MDVRLSQKYTSASLHYFYYDDRLWLLQLLDITPNGNKKSKVSTDKLVYTEIGIPVHSSNLIIIEEAFSGQLQSQ